MKRSNWAIAVALLVLTVAAWSAWRSVAAPDDGVAVERERLVSRDVMVRIEEIVTVERAVIVLATASALSYAWPHISYLAALYTLIRPERLLDDATRSRAYEAIRARPGISLQDLQHGLAVERKTLVYHLVRLEKAGFARSVRTGRQRRFFPVDADAREAARLELASQPTRREILRLIHEMPGTSQRNLRDQLGLSSALASWHLRKLALAGMIRVEAGGKDARYFPSSPLKP